MQRILIAAVVVGLGVTLTGGILSPRHTSVQAEEPPPSSQKGATENPAKPLLIRSTKSGAWSAASTWEGNKVPDAGSRVQVAQGHAVIYDLKSDAVIRSIHVAGALTFARDRDTRLDVGLIKIQAGDDASEDGFDCDAHMEKPDAHRPRPALEVGSQGDPIPSSHTATIRLTHVDGLDKQSCPAIVCCGGRMDFHGAPLERTWVKLARSVQAGDEIIEVRDSLAGWKKGDQVILTGTHRPAFDFEKSVFPRLSQTEQRKVVEAKSGRTGWTLKLDKPTTFAHFAEGDYRGEVANLSRNVVVESAAPDGVRGHTMYHRHSAGSISYAEFRHLGKKDVLGRYALHFHLCRDTMRGSSVIGASIHDSHNRWLTIHGTQYLVVRDCVGYGSVGHGFFLEDATETFNILDRNLAALVLPGKPLPDQVLPFDQNRGAGFWWANSLNSFTRNVAVECAEYGYNFEARKADKFDPVRPILQADGTTRKQDVRVLPFVRFEDNEGHSLPFFGLNLRGLHRPESGIMSFSKQNKQIVAEAAEAHPDGSHPFHIRKLRFWDSNWSFHAGTTGVFLDGFDVYRSTYGIWRSVIDRHTYRNTSMREIGHRDMHMPLSMPLPAGDENDGPHQGKYYAGIGGFLDDQPPLTVITHVQPKGGRLLVRGVTADSSSVKRVTVNGRRAYSLRDDHAEWEIELDVPGGDTAIAVSAFAEDIGGRVEKTPHRVQYDPRMAGAGSR